MVQIALDADASAEHPEADAQRNDGTREVAIGVAYRQTAIANVVFVGAPQAGDGAWVLIDTGIPGSAELIRSAAKARFGGTR